MEFGGKDDEEAIKEISLMKEVERKREINKKCEPIATDGRRGCRSVIEGNIYMCSHFFEGRWLIFLLTMWGCQGRIVYLRDVCIPYRKKKKKWGNERSVIYHTLYAFWALHSTQSVSISYPNFTWWRMHAVFIYSFIDDSSFHYPRWPKRGSSKSKKEHSTFSIEHVSPTGKLISYFRTVLVARSKPSNESRGLILTSSSTAVNHTAVFFLLFNEPDCNLNATLSVKNRS